MSDALRLIGSVGTGVVVAVALNVVPLPGWPYGLDSDLYALLGAGLAGYLAPRPWAPCAGAGVGVIVTAFWSVGLWAIGSAAGVSGGLWRADDWWLWCHWLTGLAGAPLVGWAGGWLARGVRREGQ